MAADNKLELVIQVDADKANASIQSVTKSLSGLEKEAVSSAKGASQRIDGMTLSMTKAVGARAEDRSATGGHTGGENRRGHTTRRGGAASRPVRLGDNEDNFFANRPFGSFDA